MERDELKSFIKDLLIDNIVYIVYDGYTDFCGNAITEIDYDKTVDGIVNDLKKSKNYTIDVLKRSL